MFQDRIDAGRQLAEKLRNYAGKKDVIVLAIPRGGVPVGYTVAHSLHLPLDIILAKKIGHPMNKEYAIGAASLSDYFIIPHEDVTDAYVVAELKRVRDRLTEMDHLFRNNRPALPLEGKHVIVVDDGIATGNTLLATVRLIRKCNPYRIIIAVPVASHDAIDTLRPVCDEIVCLLIPEYFGGVGSFYEDFRQVSDEEVMQYLDKKE